MAETDDRQGDELEDVDRTFDANGDGDDSTNDRAPIIDDDDIPF